MTTVPKSALNPASTAPAVIVQESMAWQLENFYTILFLKGIKPAPDYSVELRREKDRKNVEPVFKIVLTHFVTIPNSYPQSETFIAIGDTFAEDKVKKVTYINGKEHIKVPVLQKTGFEEI